MNNETRRNNKPASHVGRKQLVLELEIDLLLSSARPHGVLVTVVQIAEHDNNEHQKSRNCYNITGGTSTPTEECKSSLFDQCVHPKTMQCLWKEPIHYSAKPF
jgi:hypothetical protein